MNAISNVSRREFVKGVFSTGTLVLSASILPESLWAQTSPLVADETGSIMRPNVFVAIQSDDTISIVAARSEMGTGISTALPLVLADELDADWSKLKIHQGDGDKRYGDQDTDGSHSVRSFFDVMRGCGASARYMLIQAAAAQWKVPATACETGLGTVIHRPSGRKATYGQLAASASKLAVPDPAKLSFRPASAWRYIGKDTPRYNLAALCTGQPVFGSINVSMGCCTRQWSGRRCLAGRSNLTTIKTRSEYVACIRP
jgi:isoquinoline 1-oxidoreductase beta subunit